jgi:hypothetical protein
MALTADIVVEVVHVGAVPLVVFARYAKAPSPATVKLEL